MKLIFFLTGYFPEMIYLPHDAFTFNKAFWVKTSLSTTLNGQNLLLDVFY